MPREPIDSNTELPSLRRDVDALSERMFLEVSGRRCALLGNELGNFECWIWPIKVCHDLQLSIDGTPGAKLARSVQVWPHQSRIEYEGGDVRVTQTMFAALDRRAIVVLFDVECERAVEFVLRFTPDFRPMWPAGMGGQIALVDESGAFALTEELGRFAAMFGSPDAEAIRVDADHALPREPVAIRMLVTPGRAKRGPIPFFITGGETEPKPLSKSALVGEEGAAMGHSRAHTVLTLARDEYRRIASDWPQVLEQLEAHWRDFLARTTHFESDDALHTEAFLWAKIAIEKAWVEVDGLGRGLVAGLGPSRGGERPGFGWFFDGDAMEASRAMVAYGDFEGAKHVLEFAASHQRADGKMMHELVLSARLCNWVEDYPYAYYKAGNTPDFIDAVDDYVSWSHDRKLLERLKKPLRRAYKHCVRCLDRYGLLSNRKAGIAAVEAGPLVGAIEAEIFLHSLWLAALNSMKNFADELGDRELLKDVKRRRKQSRKAAERFWSKRERRYGFARLRRSKRCDDLTAYQAHLLARAWHDDKHQLATASALNRPTLASDWGLRFFATDSSVYDASNYNTGSVFPYANNFAILGLFKHELTCAPHQLLASQIALHGFGGLGFVPEHLYGDRCEMPPRSVPHQIFSSSCIVEATLCGMVGWVPRSPVPCVLLAPSLDPSCDLVRVERLRTGKCAVSIELIRERRNGRTLLKSNWQVAGGELDVLYTQCLPPLSRDPVLRRADGTVEPDCDLGRSRVSLFFATFARSAPETSYVLEFESGPELTLDRAPTARGATSSKLRVCEVVHDDRSVEWTLWGLADRTYRIGWRSDRRIEFSGAKTIGAELEITFPDGPSETFVSSKLRAVALD